MHKAISTKVQGKTCFETKLNKVDQYFVGMRGIYTGVRMETEESGFSKQNWMMAWPHDLTES